LKAKHQIQITDFNLGNGRVGATALGKWNNPN
jgi:hypothetical protein